MAGWVCLMYHDVTPAAVGVSGGKQHFSVGAAVFARQLDLLCAGGYAGLSLAAAPRAEGARVAISFDDGDLGQYHHAFPALAERGMSATFFITTSWVGRPEYVTWAQLREMRAAGMSIESHTHTHPFLSELGEAALREELHAAKAALDDGLGQDTGQLALPGGDRPAAHLAHLIRETGFRVVATSRWGVNRAVPGETDLAWVRRCTVRGAPGEAWFGRVIAGDQWLAFSRIVREEVLYRLRATLGPSRYARLRRGLLDVVRGS